MQRSRDPRIKQVTRSAMVDPGEDSPVDEGLRLAEERLRLLVSLCPAILYIGEPFPPFRFSFISPNVRSQLGYEPREVTENSNFWVDNIHPEDAPDVLGKSGWLMGHATHAVEYRFRHKDGSYRWMMDKSKLVQDNDGKPVEIVGFWCDITERKQLEAAVKANEERFRGLIENALDIVYHYRLSPTRGFEYVSPSAETMIGYTQEEYYSDPDLGFKIVHPDDAKLLQQIAEGNLAEPVALRWIRKDGSVVWTETRNVPIHDEAGNLIAIEGIARDVTRQKLAEEALKESEERYRKVLENIDEIVYQVQVVEGDPFRGTVQFVSGGAESVIGYSPEEFMSDTGLWFSIIHPNDRAAVQAQTALIFASGNPGTREYRLRHKETGEYHWMEDRVQPQREVSGSVVGFLGVARDITQRKHAEEQLEDSREQLRAFAARLQEVREEQRLRVAREVHDELGQVLTAVKMRLGALGMRLRDAADPVQPDHVVDELDSMDDVLDGGIQSVRRIIQELRPGLLDDLGLRDAVEWQLEEFQKRTGISYQFQSSLESVQSNSDCSTAVFRIFQETLTNIARHAEATHVGVDIREDCDMLVLAVSDNGKGITEEQVTSVASFGLLGMRERVLLCDGEISIRGFPGKGTTVTVQVPLSRFSVLRERA